MEDKKVVLSVKDLNVKFTSAVRFSTPSGAFLWTCIRRKPCHRGRVRLREIRIRQMRHGLLDANGYIDGGSILYNGMDLTKFQTDKDMAEDPGQRDRMVFQDPMTSLNPLKTIGKQIQEAVGAASGSERQGCLQGRAGGAERRGH